MRPLSELPNTEGFRFVGIRHDGSRVACVVRRDPVSRCHYVAEGITYAALAIRGLAGWEPTEPARDCPDCAGSGTAGVLQMDPGYPCNCRNAPSRKVTP